MTRIKRYLPIFAIICIIMHTVDGSEEYTLSLAKGMTLQWNIDYKNSIVNFMLEISGLPQHKPFTTMAGLGFSDRGYVTDADIVIMRYDDESVDIEDSWSDKEGNIRLDYQQDYNLDGYDVKSNHVSIAFNRKINTNDVLDYIFDRGTLNMFYILEFTDNAAFRDLTSATVEDYLENIVPPPQNAKDMKTEMISFQLLKPDIPSSYFGNETAVSFFTIRQRNVSLPTQVTTYWCSTGKLPDLIQTKTHSIGFGPNITEENRDVVHHLDVFLCDPADGNVTEYSGICNSENKPADVARCNRVAAAWAMGAADFFYPKIAGMPFGEKGESRYFRIEVHYNNPKLISGLYDSSGLNFYYTDTLRKYDAGILQVGLTYNDHYAIPPRSEHFALAGGCPGSCTMEALDSNGIKVFGSQLHSHLTGREMWVSHYRGETKLPDLNEDDHYQTMFQEIRQIYPPIDVIRGDSLVTTCIYNTMDRPNVTTTGYNIIQEMCVTYLFYYPVSSLEVCKSTTSARILEEFFEVEKLLTGKPREINFTDLGDNYQNLQWTPELIKKLEIMYENAPQDVACETHNGDQLPGNWTHVSMQLA